MDAKYSNRTLYVTATILPVRQHPPTDLARMSEWPVPVQNVANIAFGYGSGHHAWQGEWSGLRMWPPRGEDRPGRNRQPLLLHIVKRLGDNDRSR